MTRPGVDQSFTFPFEEGRALAAALEDLALLVRGLAARVRTTRQEAPAVMAGRTAGRVELELGQVLGDLDAVASLVEAEADQVRVDLRDGHAGRQRQHAALWRHEQDLRRWRPAHGAGGG